MIDLNDIDKIYLFTGNTDDFHDLIWGINPASGSLLEKAVNYAK